MGKEGTQCSKGKFRAGCTERENEKCFSVSDLFTRLKIPASFPNFKSVSWQE